MKIDGLVKSPLLVTPAKAGVQKRLKRLDSRLRRDFNGLVYFTLVTSFAAFTKRTGHTYFTHGHLGTASAGRLKEYDRRVYGIEVHDPCHLGESCKRVHVLLETEIKFKIIEPWDRWFHAF